MDAATPWSDPATLSALSRRKIGRDLARRVVARLVERDGRYGLYNTHRDYCGHGLIYDQGRFRLVEVHDGYAKDGNTLLSWDDKDGLIDWLARQSDFSLSGADPAEPALYTTEPFSLNNQRLTREGMLSFLHGGPTLPAFFDYLEGMDQALRFLVDDYGFERLTPQVYGRECVVNYRRRPVAGFSVTSEGLTTPYITASRTGSGDNDGFSNQAFHLLVRKRAPDWRLPTWRTGDVAVYREFFESYAMLLRAHFRDLLGEATAGGGGEGQWKPARSPKASAARHRSTGVAISVGALLLMIAELRYFIAHDTPSATGSVRGNLGLMLLMSVPWIVLVVGLLLAVLGVGLRGLNDAFAELSLAKRILLGVSVLSVSIIATAITASIA